MRIIKGKIMGYDASNIKVIRPESMSELIEVIRERPYFVGEKSIHHLNNWLNGLLTGIMYSENGLNVEFKLKELDDFIHKQ